MSKLSKETLVKLLNEALDLGPDGCCGCGCCCGCDHSVAERRRAEIRKQLAEGTQKGPSKP